MLRGPFSAVSKPNFASEHACCNIFQILPDLHTFAPFQSLNILLSSKKSVYKISKTFSIFNEKIEIREWCKGVHCVDLGESFQTHIFLQNLVSIQPRTSPVKFARSSNAAELVDSKE